MYMSGFSKLCESYVEKFAGTGKSALSMSQVRFISNPTLSTPDLKHQPTKPRTQTHTPHPTPQTSNLKPPHLNFPNPGALHDCLLLLLLYCSRALS